MTTTFERMHEDRLTGKLTMVDRIIFKGHLRWFFCRDRLMALLSRQSVLLKDFGRHAQAVTAEIRGHANRLAERAGRPVVYLSSARTRAAGHTKEQIAREIAHRDGITEGLICVLSTLEVGTSVDVRGNRATHRLEIIYRPRKCIHLYFYFIDPEFGFMHVRLQTWFPFKIQVYVNGREWLARQLDRLGIPYLRHDNCLLHIHDLPAALRLAERFAHRRWPGVLDALARRVNPWLAVPRRLGFPGYFWVIDQCEIATDLMFRDRKTLTDIVPDLFEYAAHAFSAQDVLRFLGRKLSPSFLGEVQTSDKTRPEGRRIRHWMKRNSLKMYDKWSVLRVETTINNPGEFKVLRRPAGRSSATPRWMPMAKAVANLWRYVQVATQANERYLDALGRVQPDGEAVRRLDDLCRSRNRRGTHFPRLNPVSAADCQLFAAVLAGPHFVNGFRNRDIARRLYRTRPANRAKARSRCARVSRLIRKLRGHGLVAKVPGSRLYRVTEVGLTVMSAALRFRHDFPRLTRQAA